MGVNRGYPSREECLLWLTNACDVGKLILRRTVQQLILILISI